MPRAAQQQMMEQEEADEEEEHHGMEEQTIDKLQDMGINMSDISKLKAAGIYTMSGVLMQSTKVRN
jgi:hypothetical protein